MSVRKIERHPVHLGLGATADVEPEFTGSMDWYVDYAIRHAHDGNEGRLVSMHTFSEPWDIWEMHPNGSEVVLCISGSMRLLQEKKDGSRTSLALESGHYAINEAGTWHTADIDTASTVLFITAGSGTQHRAR